MTLCQLLLTLGFVLITAKYVPKSSLSNFSEVLQNHPEHHPGRVLGDDPIESYRRHRYYNITFRIGHEHKYGWKEINRIGTRSTVSDVDDVPFERIRLNKWSFRFYGHLHNEIFISSNGFVTVMPDYTDGPCGRAFCDWNGHYYRRYIAPLMTDWNPGASNASQVYYTFGVNDDGENYLVVEWEKITLWSSNNTYLESPFTYQVIIEEDGDIIFNYKKLPFDPHTKMLVDRGYRFKYPVKIGLEDAFIYRSKKHPEFDGISWAYYPLKLSFDNITHHQGRSIRFKALATCQQFKTCETCVAYTELHKHDPHALQCAYCGAIKVCSDAVGREIASEADSCMSSRKQMQRNSDQCKMFKANNCGKNNSTEGWPSTIPGRTAVRSCELGVQRELGCPISACYELRPCDVYGKWENISAHCDRNKSTIPCPEDGEFKSAHPGNISDAPCENGKPGKMIRYCNLYGQWSDTDISACAIQGSLKTGQIVGIAVGSLVAVFIIILLVWLLQKNKKEYSDFRRLHNQDEPTEMVPTATK